MVNLPKSQELVAHTGFGPVISSLRGTRPRPLDECALKNILLLSSFSKHTKAGTHPGVLQI
jgi:hypothetical protein